VTPGSAALASIVKANDVRGRVPDQLDANVAHAFGAAFATLVAAPQTGALVVGRDMREHSTMLCAAFVQGAISRGARVIDLGLASTDEVYFASGQLDLPGAIFTPSHNPADYGGIKLMGRSAAPMGLESGLAEVAALAGGLLDADPSALAESPVADPPGTVGQRDVLADYAAHLRSLVDLSGSRPLTVVADAGNGMAGLTARAVFAGTSITLVPLYFELDGTFPHHDANPLVPENLLDLQRAVVEHGADAGLAFDGDADRCFLVDANGVVVPPSAITALIATRELARHPGAGIIHNLITSRAVPEIVTEHGGTPIRTRVGHSFIKAVMAQTGAVFGGEHSGHYYFRDFWGADSGMLAALHVLAALGETDTNLATLASSFRRYEASGELNRTVGDPPAALARVRALLPALAGLTGVRPDEIVVDDLDGLSLTAPPWWLNVRPSNTEPVVRLNVEAADAPMMAALRDRALAAITSTEETTP
jgi:phosphomannomutase